MRSGLPPAMEDAVQCVIAAQQSGGDDTPLRAGELGQAFADAIHQLVILTNPREASSMAFFTSGRVVDPVMMVNVPRALITGRTPMER